MFLVISSYLGLCGQSSEIVWIQKRLKNWLKSIDICEESSLTGSSTVACADMNND